MSAALSSTRTLTPTQVSSIFVSVVQSLIGAQVMELAKRGSVRHLEQLADGIKKENYKIEVLEVFLDHLAVPDRNEGIRNRNDVAFFVLGKGLDIAVRQYSPHIEVEIGSRIAAASEGILFWMNLFTGGASDPQSEWDFEDPDGQRGQHAHNVYDYTDLILLILRFEAVAKTMGQLPEMHNLILRWWMATCNGEILLYPWSGRAREPQADGYDFLVLILSYLTKDFAKEMAEVIMAPHPGCSTGRSGAFAQRTIQRMHALARINAFRHLAHLPDATNEYKNIGAIVFSIRHLVDANPHLHAALLRQNISDCCVEVLQLLGERSSLQPPTSASMKDFSKIIQNLNMVVEWSSDAPVSLATTTMKRLLGKGLLDTVAEYINHRALAGHLREVCDAVEQSDKAVSDTLAYSRDSALCPRVAATFSRSIRGLMNKINRPLPSVRLEKAVEDSAVGFLEHLPHLRKKNRVRTCGSLQVRSVPAFTPFVATPLINS